MSLYHPTNWLEKEVALFLWKVTPPCRSMTRLMSEAMDHPISRRKRVAIYLHRMTCLGCKRYQNQLHFTHDTLQGLEIHLGEVSRDSLPPSVKNQLKHSLHDSD